MWWLAWTAQAFEVTGRMWFEPDMPVHLVVSSHLPESLTEDDVALAMDAAIADWTQECSGFSVTWEFDVAERERDARDAVNGVYFEDPDDEIEASTIAATFPNQENVRNDRDGVTYGHFTDSDTVFNDGVDWYTDAAIDAGDCMGEGMSFQAELTHQIGHIAGLAHSCEGLPCDVPEDEAATMFSEQDACSTARSTTEPDDRLGLRAIYGPWLGVSCAAAADTGVGALEVTCEVTSDDSAEVTDVSWDFGDGGSEAGRGVTHTYDAPGRYTITACSTFERCGGEVTCDPFVLQVGPPAEEGGDSGAPDPDTAAPSVSGDGSGSTDCGCGGGRSAAGAGLLLLALGRRGTRARRT